MAGGALWAVALVWLPQRADLPFIPAPVALPLAFLAPGLVLAAMIGRLAQRRFFDDEIIDGAPFAWTYVPFPCSDDPADNRTFFGKHDMTIADWQVYMDFAQKHLNIIHR